MTNWPRTILLHSFQSPISIWLSNVQIVIESMFSLSLRFFFLVKLNLRILYCEIRPTLLHHNPFCCLLPTGCCAKKNLLLRCRLNRNGSNAQLFVFWDQESGNLMLKAIGFWFCCSSLSPTAAAAREDEVDRRWTLFLPCLRKNGPQIERD